jgi:PAS domain S-box-containing protein
MNRLAWLPIPLMIAVVALLWVVDPRVCHESRGLTFLLNLVFSSLVGLCIATSVARSFMSSGQPGLLMFGCGSLVWGVTSLAAAMMIDRVNTTITVHNVGVLGAAVCHGVGLLWRGRLSRRGSWLGVGYASALLVAALICWSARAGLTPLFFVQGQGGTPVRQGVLVLAIVLFGWVARQMLFGVRRPSGTFYYWYGLGLALVATGLTGVMLLSVQGGILGWTNRLTQYLGSAYLFAAAVAAARETGTWTITPPARTLWRKTVVRGTVQNHARLLHGLRYGLAVLTVAAALGVRLALEDWIGPGLPTYVTLYPAIMLTAVLGGMAPGILATVLASLVSGYWILPPVGHFSIASPVDRLGLLIFSGMGLFMSQIAELYRRHRDQAAVYDRERALYETQSALRRNAATLAEAERIANLGSWEWDLTSDEVLWSDHLYRIFGEEKGSFVPTYEGFMAHVHPDDRDRADTLIRDAVARGVRFAIEFRVVPREGATRVIAAEAEVVPGADGRPGRVTGIAVDITARVRAAEVLRQGEQKYRVLFENMTEGFALYELLYDAHGHPVDWRVMEINDAYTHHTGITRERILGRRISEVFPAAVAEYLPRFSAVVATQTPSDYETYATSVGRYQHVVTFPAGGPRFANIIEDITIRKQAEESLRESRTAALNLMQDAVAARQQAERTTAALRESESRYRTLFDTMSEGLALHEIITDEEGRPYDYRYLDANPAFERQTGLKRADLIGRRVREILPSTKAYWIEAFGNVALTGVPAHLQNYSAALARWYEVFAYQPAPRQFAAIVTDITARKLADEALRESELFHRQTLESVPGMTFTTRPDGYCDYQSQQWADFTGVPTSEHVGDGWVELLHPDDRPRAHEAWHAAVAGRAPYDLEYRVRRHDGVYEWFKVSGRPIRNSAGAIVRWFGTAVNIDGLVRAEERIKEQLAEKEVLLKEVHHRVKNNLQVISSLVSLQMEGRLDPVLKILLGDVRDRVRTMALVHEKLYQSADLGAIDFSGYARSLLMYLWRAHGSLSATVRLNLDLKPVQLSVHSAVPCGLILNELAGNTLKHAFRGRAGGSVTVTLFANEAHRVTLRMSDNGAGIPPGVNWREPTTLGLRLVQMLTQQLDGTLDQRPAAGGGTEFELVFPAAGTPAADANDPATAGVNRTDDTTPQAQAHDHD